MGSHNLIRKDIEPSSTLPPLPPPQQRNGAKMGSLVLPHPFARGKQGTDPPHASKKVGLQGLQELEAVVEGVTRVKPASSRLP